MKFSANDQWKLYGENNPFYGVLSDDKFRKENLNEELIREFYKTGQLFVQETERRISNLFSCSLENKSILDFGCGVGRLTVAFAQKTEQTVVGVDISKGMLDEARKTSHLLGTQNIAYYEYDGVTLPETDRFDLVNSYIVFQHIEPKYGYSLLDQVCAKAKEGGIVQLHLTYGQALPKITYGNFYMRTHYGWYNYLYSLFRKGKLKPEQVMQMNHYRLPRVFAIFNKYTSQFVVEPINHEGHLGAIFCFRRDK